MPDMLSGFGREMPQFTGHESTEDKVDALHSYLFMLLEELRYILHNLGQDNFNAAEWQEIIKAGTVIAQTVISNTVITNELYSVYGEIANLIVNHLRTDYTKAQKYLSGNTGDVNYIDIHDEQIDFITATVTQPLSTEQLVRDGLAFWWKDETRTQMTSEENTGIPVIVYRYDELTKLSIKFKPLVLSGGGTTWAPVITLGAGDLNGNSVATIYKGQTGLHVKYKTTGGAEKGLVIGDSGYVDIDALRRPTAYDFSDIDEGTFTETLDGGETTSYSVTRDAAGRITKITDADGHETAITWPAVQSE